MKLKTAAALMKGGGLPLLLYFKPLFTVFYRVCFLASLADSVYMERLLRGPVTLDSLTGAPGQEPCHRQALEAWLGLGVRLGVLKKEAGGYRLRGFVARKLACPENDALRALVREVAGLHHLYILHTPEKLAQCRLWDPKEQHRAYGDIIARSSRSLEPFLFEVIDRIFPNAGTVRLLEVGCGHAGYMMYAAARNKDLKGIGLELDAHVAEMARGAIQSRGLEDRIEILTQDVRAYGAQEPFDIITLYNNIYYFPVEERRSLLELLSGLLKPGGRLVLTTGCTNGGIEFELVNVIHAATRGWGRLPHKDELLRQLDAAGFERISALRLVPGDEYYAFIGYLRG